MTSAASCSFSSCTVATPLESPLFLSKWILEYMILVLRVLDKNRTRSCLLMVQGRFNILKTGLLILMMVISIVSILIKEISLPIV